jgi:hypothetical protein
VRIGGVEPRDDLGLSLPELVLGHGACLERSVELGELGPDPVLVVELGLGALGDLLEHPE